MDVLGEGGFSAVYEAVDVKDSTTRVALKLLHGSPENRHFAEDLITREIEILSALRHDNIMPLLETGKDSRVGRFFTMPLLKGQTLQELLSRASKPGRCWQEVVPLVHQMLAAQDFVHVKGVIHRDLNPANCFMADTEPSRQVLKVIDFGIAGASGLRTGPIPKQGGGSGHSHQIPPPNGELECDPSLRWPLVEIFRRPIRWVQLQMLFHSSPYLSPSGTRG